MAEDLLGEVAQACRLREGSEGVRALLRAVHQHGKIPLRAAAMEIGLPLPVAAAVRRELEKRGLLLREAGMVLSEQGKAYAEAELDLGEAGAFECPLCEGRLVILGPNEDPLVGRIRRLFEQCPPADVTLDQSHNTPETAVRRVLYMADRGAIEGRTIVFIGDDDLMSVAVGIAVKQLRLGKPARLVVVDIDSRILDATNALSRQEALGIQCIEHDVRHPLPSHLQGEFDTFVTDPPYTLEGGTLFASRGAEALKCEPMKQGFLSFGRKDPATMVELQVRLGQMGLAISQVLPCFSDYDGAAILGGTSQMIHLLSCEHSRPCYAMSFDGPLYTADAPGRAERRGGPAASTKAPKGHDA